MAKPLYVDSVAVNSLRRACRNKSKLTQVMLTPAGIELTLCKIKQWRKKRTYFAPLAGILYVVLSSLFCPNLQRNKLK